MLILETWVDYSVLHTHRSKPDSLINSVVMSLTFEQPLQELSPPLELTFQHNKGVSGCFKNNFFRLRYCCRKRFTLENIVFQVKTADDAADCVFWDYSLLYVNLNNHPVPYCQKPNSLWKKKIKTKNKKKICIKINQYYWSWLHSPSILSHINKWILFWRKTLSWSVNKVFLITCSTYRYCICLNTYTYINILQWRIRRLVLGGLFHKCHGRWRHCVPL